MFIPGLDACHGIFSSIVQVCGVWYLRQLSQPEEKNVQVKCSWLPYASFRHSI